MTYDVRACVCVCVTDSNMRRLLVEDRPSNWLSSTTIRRHTTSLSASVCSLIEEQNASVQITTSDLWRALPSDSSRTRVTRTREWLERLLENSATAVRFRFKRTLLIEEREGFAEASCSCHGPGAPKRVVKRSLEECFPCVYVCARVCVCVCVDVSLPPPPSLTPNKKTSREGAN